MKKLLLTVLILAGFAAVNQMAFAQVTLSSGMKFPDFAEKDLAGKPLSLSGLKGKVVLVDFWATWCPPCRAEMPWLVKLGARMESQGVVFIAISEDDPPGQVPLVNEFAREVPGLERFAVLGDPELESAYGVTSLPTLFVLDRQGQLVQKFVGSADEGELVELVERLAR